MIIVEKHPLIITCTFNYSYTILYNSLLEVVILANNNNDINNGYYF